MPLDLKIRPEQLGVRLRNARSNLRHTQDAVSQALGIARTTIAAMESGKRPVDAKHLRAFAEFYRVSEHELVGAERQPLDLEVKFRAAASPMAEEAQARAATTLVRLATGALELESLVAQQPPALDYPHVRLDPTADLEQQAEDAAMALRQRLGLGIGPIPHLLSLMESDLGLRVFERPLPSGVSGAVAFDPNHGGFVVLNSIHPVERRRNTAAHELAHPLLRKPGVSVLREDDKLEDREDRFCDAFGRAFLMPASAVRRKHAELRAIAGTFTVRHILVMALYFLVSVEAMTRRLEALALVPKGMYDSLRERGLTASHTKTVQAELRADPPPSFTPHTYLLAGAAYDKELLSAEQVARLLDIDLVSTRRLLQEFSSEGEALLEPNS